MMNLENPLLYERSQLQRVMYHMIPFIRNVQTGNLVKTESRSVVSGPMGQGEWRVMASGHEFGGGW